MDKQKSQYGTFRESMRAPIHGWFTYPAGYSYRLVEVKIEEAGLMGDSLVLDPFLGSGTTSVAAKALGVQSIGYEAHPFVSQIAKAKLNWSLDTDRLRERVGAFAEFASRELVRRAASIDLDQFPELLPKCYSDGTLRQLGALWNIVQESDLSEDELLFFKVAMTNVLRVVSSAGTGWPYIAPTKFAEKKVERPALPNLLKRLDQMILDLDFVKNSSRGNAESRLVQGDSRRMTEVLDESVDLVVTSPPYLNNFDYADRTRLEMYFFGEADSWGEITEKVRSQLIVAATTQVNSSSVPSGFLIDEIEQVAPALYKELLETVHLLGKTKRVKKGKKNYDWMVAGYFNDIYRVLSECSRAVKPGGVMHWVLGDSAPYGHHIPTEKFIGDLALGLGFSDYSIEVLRRRGEKWKNNPQRHGVMLQESILTIRK